ncbi:MAG: lipopolysaccharide export system protein LptC [Gammaproteobacteria bacterium]|jgi:lipopolysaccharide export system protein LptC
MSGRIVLIVILAIAALSSGWMMNRLIRPVPQDLSSLDIEPDYYMEDFTTITIGDDGLPLNTLYAIYMEHNPADDSFQLQQPKLEIYRTDNNPLYITAEKGRATDNNEVILLQGKVRMWEENNAGETTLNLETSEVRILVLEEYAETDQNAVITGKHTTIIGRGVRANFKDSRLEILNHEQTIISQPDKI